MDPRARPRLRYPVERQLLLLARAEGGALADGGEDRVEAPEDAPARARVDPHVAASSAGQGAGAGECLRDLAEPGFVEAAGRRRDLHPAASPNPGSARSRRHSPAPAPWPAELSATCGSTRARAGASSGASTRSSPPVSYTH